MLLILMYHKIIAPQTDHTNLVNKLEQHLKYLQQNFYITLPGQNLLKHNVCLTFDDAYVDFYHYVFPILKKLNIPAILAIPTGLIEDSTNIPMDVRLDTDYTLGATPAETKSSHLCTWEEIRKMMASGLIYPASHSLFHKNLAKINIQEAYQEICVSKRNILTKLENIPETLIYPFGAVSPKIQSMANSHYRYVMRIGGASNVNWNQKVLYRINAEPFWKENKKISKLNILWWKIKYYWNKCRGK